MPKIVSITKENEAGEVTFSRDVNLVDSVRPKMRYHLPRGKDGLHFDKLESVEKYFKRKYPGHKIEIN